MASWRAQVKIVLLFKMKDDIKQGGFNIAICKFKENRIVTQMLGTLCCY